MNTQSNAIRYRWDSTRLAYVVEVLAEQPDGTTATHTHSKHESQWDAAAAVLQLREERKEKVSA